MDKKQQAMNVIKQLGYEVEDRNGVVVAIVHESDDYLKAKKIVGQALKAIGYDRSFGAAVAYKLGKKESET